MQELITNAYNTEIIANELVATSTHLAVSVAETIVAVEATYAARSAVDSTHRESSTHKGQWQQKHL